ncbi:hypothetical protein VTJ49DRAFT_2631 [Mycothermus thermophilus]|uniref:Uncharacterized protein n=1 Tax=Humicola insolens TaxID=85995 RepID=A0ABR3V9E0_HUMIN
MDRFANQSISKVCLLLWLSSRVCKVENLGRPGSCPKQLAAARSFRQVQLKSGRAPLPCGSLQKPKQASGPAADLPHFSPNPPHHFKNSFCIIPSFFSLFCSLQGPPRPTNRYSKLTHGESIFTLSSLHKHALGESPRTTTFRSGSWTRRRAAIEAPRLISAWPSHLSVDRRPAYSVLPFRRGKPASPVLRRQSGSPAPGDHMDEDTSPRSLVFGVPQASQWAGLVGFGWAAARGRLDWECYGWLGKFRQDGTVMRLLVLFWDFPGRRVTRRGSFLVRGGASTHNNLGWVGGQS